MADIKWLGTASAVAQIAQKNVASSTLGHTFTITLAYENGTTALVMTHTVDAVDAGNTTTIASEIQTEFNALTHVLATPITASNSTSKLILTADTAGKPFYITYGGTGTWDDTACTNTANSGPNDWNVAANWSGGVVPAGAAADSVYLEDNAVDILYGLDQDAVTLIKLRIMQSYTGLLGDGTYYLRILSPLVDIGEQYGASNATGSQRLMIDTLNTASTITVHDSAVQSTTTGTEQYKQPIRLLCNHADTVLNVRRGIVGIAMNAPGEIATLGTINCSYVTSVESDAEVVVGPGVTWITLTKTGGKATVLSTGTTVYNSAGDLLVDDAAGTITTLSAKGGTVQTRGGLAVTNLTVWGGDCKSDATGTVATLKCYGGNTSFLGNNAARTVTTCEYYSGAALEFDVDVVTFTNKILLDTYLDLQVSAA